MATSTPVTITPNNKLLSNLFFQMVLGQGEYPTSTKFNTFSNYTSQQFALEELAIGNIFELGQPSIAFTIGDPRLITPSSAISDSSGFINTFPPLYTSNNSYQNQLPCSIDNGGVVTLNSPGLINDSLQENFSGSSGIVSILNIIVATINNQNQIISIIPGVYQTNSGWTLNSGSLNSFTIAGFSADPSATYVVLVPNYSLSSSIITNMTNIGSIKFLRANSYYVDDPVEGTNDDTFTTFASNKSVTLTNLLNRIDGKLFAVNFHIRVQVGTGSNSGSFTVWAITPNSIQIGITSANPSLASIQAYITHNMIAQPQTNSAPYDIFATINGAAVTTNSGSIVVPTISYPTPSNQVLQFGIPTSVLSNLGSGNPSQIPAYIDFYIPVGLSYYGLQSRSLSFGNQNAQLPDLIKNVIGTQYGWNLALYPDTIANRLDYLTTQLGAINSTNGIVQQYLVNGSTTITTGANTKLIYVTLVGAGGGGGGSTTASNHSSGGGGGQGGVIKAPVQVSPLTSYTIIVGQGGAGGTNNNISSNAGTDGTGGGNTTFQQGATILLQANGGAFGQGGHAGATPAGGNGGTASFPGVVAYTIQNLIVGGNGGNGSVTAFGESNGGAGGNVTINGLPYLHTSGGIQNSQNNGGAASLPSGAGAGGAGAANGSVNQGGQNGLDGLAILEF